MLRSLFLFALLATVAGGGCAGGQGAGEPSSELTGGTVEESESRVRAALDQYPDDAELNMLLARSLAEQGKLSEASLYFQRAEELDPSQANQVDRERDRFAGTYQDEARTFLEKGDLAGARGALDQASLLAPEGGETLFLTGWLEEMEGNGAAAYDSYRRAWEENPREEERRDALAQILVASARAHYEVEDYVAAWDRLEEARQVDADAPDIPYLRGMVAYAQAQELEEEEARIYLEEAARSFQQVLEKVPDDDDARFNLGAVFMGLGRWGEAGEIYEDLLLRNPTDGRLYQALARAHSLAGDNERAMAEEAVGRALRADHPVEDSGVWARRAAERFPESEIAEEYQKHGAPDSIYTYTIPGGDLVEVWFYWEDGVAEAFREGARLGSTVFLGGR